MSAGKGDKVAQGYRTKRMNLCDAVITKIHYIKETEGVVLFDDVPGCYVAYWECKFTYNCYGAIETRTVYGYSEAELKDKYYEGKEFLT